MKKTTIKQLSTFCLLILMLLLNACVLSSKQPLSEEAQASWDKRLLGVWYWQEDNEIVYLHIGQLKDSNGLRVILVEHQKSGIKQAEYRGHVTQLQIGQILNLRGLKKGKYSDWLFARYTISSDGSLSLSFALPKAGIKPITTGQLKGKINKGQFLTSVTLNDEGSKIRTFFEQASDLFAKQGMTFRRISL